MCSSPATSTTSSSRMLEMSMISFYNKSLYSPIHYVSFPCKTRFLEKNQSSIQSRNLNGCFISCCSSINANNDIDTHIHPTTITPSTTIVTKKKNRYRKQYPGESKGIVEEMRFVAMKLRNDNIKKGRQGAEMKEEEEAVPSSSGNDDSTWQPSMEGFAKYLVDSKLVFDTVERVIDESNHVSYSYFKRTGLERSQGLSKDIEWFGQQDILIPPPSTLGVSYAEYLDKIANKCAPSFLSHFYNIHFAHIAGGQVIAKQVSDELLDGRELEFCKWNGDVPEMLKDVREKLNKLGENWSRDQKSRCLKAAAMSFRYTGQIIRLIVL